MIKKLLKEELNRMSFLAGIINESDEKSTEPHSESYRIKSDVGLLLSVDDSALNELKDIDLPDGQTRLPEEKFHITLTSIKNFKPFHSEMKNLVLPKYWKDGKEVIVPTVKIKEYKSVFRPGQEKETYVAGIENQNDFQKFVDKLYAEYGLENPESNTRFYHITVSNNMGGDPFKSIGDVGAQDFN